MAAASEGVEKTQVNNDFYAVLGLSKECSGTELRNAYKKLALKWHPDRCSASGNEKNVEEAKTKFQDIQQAYAVLSDSNKRFMYDIGVYEGDDEENGMGDFLNEMATMMSQTKPNEKGEESLDELKEIFEEMFQGPIGSFSSSSSSFSGTNIYSNSTGYAFYSNIYSSNKPPSSQMSYGTTNGTGRSASTDACCQKEKSKQEEGSRSRDSRRSKR